MLYYLLYLLLTFIGLMLLTQLIFFEISRNRMKKANNLNWFLSLDKPFHYNRVGYMVFICLICYLVSSPSQMFSLEWIIYFVIFLALAIISDAVVQYLTLLYGKKRCQKEIEETGLLKNELIEISQTMYEDLSYQETVQQYDEKEILRNYVQPTSHLAYLTLNGSQFVRDCQISTEATFVVEPYGDIEKVKQDLSDLPVQVTKLTPAGQMPFKDQKLDIVMCQECNYDKNEIQRILKPSGYFIVNQNGTTNFKEFIQMYVPMGLKGSWDSYSCSQTLEDIGMRIVEKLEDYGSIRFPSIQSMHSYFKRVSPDLADMNKYQVFYMNALKSIKENNFYELTTHRFLIVAQK